MWDLGSGLVVREFKGHRGPLSVVSSPDPTHKMGKGLVTLLALLGCAESAKSTCANTFS